MVCPTRVIIQTGSKQRKSDWNKKPHKKRQDKKLSRLSLNGFELIRGLDRRKIRVDWRDSMNWCRERRNKDKETTELFIPTGERLGDKVIEINAITKSFDDKCLIENFSALIPRGAIVGIIGGNGAGKSTLFKMITGNEEPDEGSIELGPTVTIAYTDQSRASLDGNKTVWEEISDSQDIIRIGRHEIATRAYVGRFNFKGTDQQKQIGSLSGGERNRVHLAKTLREGANVLLLDEPTNDLDVETLRALEEAILSFAGTALIVSHDRWFLDRVATHIIAFEGDSHLEMIEGSYSDYEVDRKKRLGDLEPTRVKYKPVSR